MISTYLYDVCSMYDVCLPVWFLHYSVLSSQLYDVLLVWCLPACKLSAQLYDVCIPVWRLLYCMTYAYLFDFFLGYLYDACLFVWWLSYLYDGPAYFYDVFLTVCVSSLLWYLPSFISAYWYDVCLPVICLPSCKVWTQLYNVRLPV
jgi:hypothetical protein